MIADFLNYLAKTRLTHEAYIEDFADKVYYGWTVLCLMMITTLLSLKHCVTKSIACYVSTIPTGSNVHDYIENLCWIQGTQRIQGQLPETELEWSEHATIVYYQWLTLVLALQATMFYCPRIVWQVVCHHSAIRVLHIQAKQGTVSELVELFHKLKQRRSFRYFFVSYLIIKFLYLTVAILCLLTLKQLIRFDTIWFGLYWDESHFPYVTYCRITLNIIGSIHTSIAQCVLPNNMLHAKVLYFLWFWYSMLCLLSLVNIVLWIIRFSVKSVNLTFVKDCVYSAMTNQCPNFCNRDTLFFARTLHTKFGERLTGDFLGQHTIMKCIE